ncbi:MAG: GatB/YqeY domain-containing protein [Sphingomonadaceae bacterium]
MIRESVTAALVEAMKAKESDRVAALRLIQAAIKNRDIEARSGGAPADDDALVIEVLQKMAKQRRESIDLYEKGGRPELAAREAGELAIIEGFLPRQLDEAEARAAITDIIAATGASSVRDMGAVMARVKAELAGRLDMALASRLVKDALS